VPLTSAIGVPLPVEDSPEFELPPCPEFELPPCPEFELPPCPEFELPPCPEFELPPLLGSVTVKSLLARISDEESHSAATVWSPTDVSRDTVTCAEKLPPLPVTPWSGFPSSSSCTDVI
jgi:hypothetical protein